MHVLGWAVWFREILTIVDFLGIGRGCAWPSGDAADDERYEELEGESAIEEDDQRPVSESDESQHPCHLNSNPQRHTGDKGEPETIPEIWCGSCLCPAAFILFSNVTMLLDVMHGVWSNVHCK